MPSTAADRARETIDKLLSDAGWIVQSRDSGGGKTFTACNASYRLIEHAGARRILFLVANGTAIPGRALPHTPKPGRKLAQRRSRAKVLRP